PDPTGSTSPSSPGVQQPNLWVTISSPGGGEGIEMAPSPSERARVGVRVRMCSRIIRAGKVSASASTSRIASLLLVDGVTSVNSIGSGAGGINSQAAGRKPPSSTNGEHATRGSPDPGARPPAGGWTRARAVAYPATGA